MEYKLLIFHFFKRLVSEMSVLTISFCLLSGPFIPLFTANILIMWLKRYFFLVLFVLLLNLHHLLSFVDL